MLKIQWPPGTTDADFIRFAAHQVSLDVARLVIQDAINGRLHSLFFDINDERAWPTMKFERRVEMLINFVKFERETA